MVVAISQNSKNGPGNSQAHPTFGFTAVAGRVVVAAASSRDGGGADYVPDGGAVFSLLSHYQFGDGQVSPWEPTLLLAAHAVGGETYIDGTIPAGSDYGAIAVELTGADYSSVYGGASTHGYADLFGVNHGVLSDTVTPPSGRGGMVIFLFLIRGDTGGFATPSGWTFLDSVGAGGDHPGLLLYYYPYSAGVGSIQFSSSISNDNRYWSSAIIVVPETSDVDVNAGSAAGAGAAYSPSVPHDAIAGLASGTGAALGATMGTFAGVAAAAASALGTAAGYEAAAGVAQATAIGEQASTDNPSGSAHPYVQPAASFASAHNPIAGGVVAGVAQATAVARSTASSVSANPTPGVAEANARARRPTTIIDGIDQEGVSPILLAINHEDRFGMEWSMSAKEVLGAVDSATVYVQDRTNTWEPEAHWDVRVIIRRNGWTLFRGEIISTPVELKVGLPWRTWKLECAGYFGEYPQRLVGAFDGKTWVDTSGFGVYVNIDPDAQSLETDRLTVQNLHDRYIRVDGQAFDTERYVGEYLTEFFPIAWSYSNLQEAHEQLAALIAANLQFWPDPDLYFHWVTIPAWQDLGTETPNIPYMDLAPAEIVDANRAEGEIGFSDLSFNLDGSEMPEQVYVRGGTGYVYNAPPVPPDEENRTVVTTPVEGSTATYELTVISTTKVWHTDATGFISLSYESASPGGPYDCVWTRVPWSTTRNKGGNFWKLTSGPFSGKLIDNDTNILAGYGRISVEATTTGPGDPDAAKIGIGGSGWTGEAAQDKNKRQAYLQAPVSTTKIIRDALGGQSIYRGATPTLRGKVKVYGIDGWRVGQLVKVTDARLPSYLNGHWFVIQQVDSSLLPANDLRRYTLGFGDGPTSRYSAQQRGGDVGWPPPAIQIVIDVLDLSPGPNSTQTITGQLTNGSGEPWAISGKTVNWSFECYNSAGVLQTDQGSIDPTVSITDKDGKARIRLTTGPGTELVYYIFARVKAV